MNNKRINLKRRIDYADGLFLAQPENMIISNEMLEQADTEVLCVESQSKSGSLKSILQRCHGMFVKEEVLQEKKRKLSNFINED